MAASTAEVVAQSLKTRRAPQNLLIIAGEASADRYGARLVQKLNAIHGLGALEFWGAGGDEMQKAGVNLACHIKELAHIGAREALANLRMYYRVYKKLIKIASEQRPSLAILLDFPDFNLRLAKKLKRLGIKVIYYISPQVWAWRSGRVRTIRKHVDRMLVILPFEEDFYRRNGVEVDFVGHPLLEDFDPVFDRDNFLRSLNLSPEIKTIALLPGSRRKEIEYILPTLIEASKLLLEKMPVQFVISAAPTIELERIEGIMQGMISREAIDSYFRVSSRSSRDILANSDFAFVKSGTSSLEAALVGVPFLITYKISPLSWLIGSILIRSSMKGLVNLIATKQIVPELFQDEAKPEELARLALECLRDPEKSAAMRAQLAGIKEQLSSRCASESVAAVVSRYL